VHPQQRPLEPEIEAIWIAALEDAVLNPDECLLYVLEGRQSETGYLGWHFADGILIHENEDLGHAVNDLLPEMNSDECIDAVRIVVWRERTIEGLAGLIRHELEHALQDEAHGQKVEELYRLAMYVIGERVSGLPGSGLLYTMIPNEFDANAAAAMFVRARYGPERVRELLEARDDDSVPCSGHTRRRRQSRACRNGSSPFSLFTATSPRRTHGAKDSASTSCSTCTGGAPALSGGSLWTRADWRCRDRAVATATGRGGYVRAGEKSKNDGRSCSETGAAAHRRRSAGASVACRTADQVGAVAELCLAFPVQPPGRPEKSRLAELDAVTVPTLVVQGKRDPFGMPPPSPNRTLPPGWASARYSLLRPRKGELDAHLARKPRRSRCARVAGRGAR
jgi:hypothetical protein